MSFCVMKGLYGTFIGYFQSIRYSNYLYIKRSQELIQFGTYL